MSVLQRNPIKSNPNQIIFTIFLPIDLEPNKNVRLLFENGKYNMIAVRFNKISKRLGPGAKLEKLTFAVQEASLGITGD